MTDNITHLPTITAEIDPDFLELDVWLAYDDNGECVVANNEEDAAAHLAEQTTGLQVRLVKITARVPVLRPIEIKAE